jgi:cell division protein ZapA
MSRTTLGEEARVAELDELQDGSDQAQSEVERAQNDASDSGAVSVDIYDQIYNLRGSDAEYIGRLAEVVDGKMRAVASCGGTVDSLRVAVLAALNIADELLALRARYDTLAGLVDRTEDTVRTRTDSLAEMLDEVLEDRRAG